MSLLDLIGEQLSGEATAQIGRQLGTDEGTARKAVAGALPVLMAALAKNASREGGAASLASALDRDHDGSVLDDLTGFLASPDTKDGEGILRHTLGSQRSAVERELGQQTGLDMSTIARLLPILAPIVMGALGRAKRQDRLGVGDLTSMLAGERQRAQTAAPINLDSLTALLDADRDGSIADEVADIGKGLLGGFLRRRR